MILIYLMPTTRRSCGADWLCRTLEPLAHKALLSVRQGKIHPVVDLKQKLDFDSPAISTHETLEFFIPVTVTLTIFHALPRAFWAKHLYRPASSSELTSSVKIVVAVCLQEGAPVKFFILYHEFAILNR